MPLVVSKHGAELSFFTTLTTFGTPLDVTLDELTIELFFPADDTTEAAPHRVIGRVGVAHYRRSTQVSKVFQETGSIVLRRITGERVRPAPQCGPTLAPRNRIVEPSRRWAVRRGACRSVYSRSIACRENLSGSGHRNEIVVIESDKKF